MKGWSVPSDRSKYHYFEDDVQSLCGNWMILNPNPKYFHADVEKFPPAGMRCVKCKALLLKALAAKEGGDE